MTQPRHERAVEKYYSPQEAGWLLGFSERFIRDLAKSEELTLKEPATGEVVAEPVLIGGELRIPASCLNGYLARHPYRTDPGIKARNKAELLRRLNGKSNQERAA